MIRIHSRRTLLQGTYHGNVTNYDDVMRFPQDINVVIELVLSYDAQYEQTVLLGVDVRFTRPWYILLSAT